MGCSDPSTRNVERGSQRATKRTLVPIGMFQRCERMGNGLGHFKSESDDGSENSLSISVLRARFLARGSSVTSASAFRFGGRFEAVMRLSTEWS